MKILAGKVAIITGASAPRGIGLAIENGRLAVESKISVSKMKQRRYAILAVRNGGQPEDVAEAVGSLAGPSSA